MENKNGTYGMMENGRILNVRLPFMEAIEHLKNDGDAIACICEGDEGKRAVIAIDEDGILCMTKGDANGNGCLAADDILEKDWFLIIKDKA